MNRVKAGYADDIANQWIDCRRQYLRGLVEDADHEFNVDGRQRHLLGNIAKWMNMYYFPMEYHRFSENPDDIEARVVEGMGRYTWRNVYDEIANNPEYYGRRGQAPHRVRYQRLWY